MPDSQVLEEGFLEGDFLEEGFLEKGSDLLRGICPQLCLQYEIQRG